MIPLLTLTLAAFAVGFFAGNLRGHKRGHREANDLWRDAGAERRRRAEQATEEAWWVGGRFKTGDGTLRN